MTAAGAADLHAKIYSTELIGDHVLVTCRREAQTIANKAPKDYAAETGANVGVKLSSQSLCFSNEKDGKRVR